MARWLGGVAIPSEVVVSNWIVNLVHPFSSSVVEVEIMLQMKSVSCDPGRGLKASANSASTPSGSAPLILYIALASYVYEA